MHQTFYIDIDEEITSVIERLRKADADEAVIVVPKQAALIQSIVNLKLLKKESERLGVGLILVTQDKLGRVMIEKAGIAVEQKLEDIEGEELLAEEKPKRGSGKKASKSAKEEMPSENRLDTIGSDSFFDPAARPKNNEYFISDEGVSSKADPVGLPNGSGDSERIVNKELVTGIALDIKKGKSTRMDALAKKALKDSEPESKESGMSFEEGIAKPEKPVSKRQSPVRRGGRLDDDKLENFFSPNLASRRPHGKEMADKLAERHPIEPAESDSDDGTDDVAYVHPAIAAGSKGRPGRGRRIAKHALSVLLLAVGCGALYAAYLYVPEATVEITTRKESKSGDVEITADAKAGSSDYGAKTIPAKLIETNVQVSDSFSPSGKSSGTSANKARGKVTLYNEFSSSPQALVATTRLEAPDGKIFRLNAGVTIPGMGKDGTPGSVEAYVTADQTGSDYDIDPTSFTVPGFKSSGSGKYSKFYAKSTEKMSGGDGSGSGAAAVTESDISNAKSKIADKIKDAIAEKAKEEAGLDAVLLDDAFESDEPAYGVSVAAGETAESFTVSASVRAQAVVFKESDIEAMASSLISNAGSLKSDLSSVSVKLDYGKSSLDLKSETLGIKAHATSSVSSGIDSDALRAGMLGKTNEELEAYLDNYSSIEKAEVTYWPPVIVNRIPSHAQRVKIEVNPEEET